MAIFFQEEQKTFYLEGKDVTYAFFINEVGYAEHLYYGKKIGRDDLTCIRKSGGGSGTSIIPGRMEMWLQPGFYASYHDFPSELSFFGTGDYREPAVGYQDKTGSRVVELLYDGYEILEEKPLPAGMPGMHGTETLVLHLKDSITAFACDLYYTIYEDTGVVVRRAVYRNLSADAVRLSRAYSFTFTLPDMDYDVLSLPGAWARERAIERIPMHHGVVSVDSKRTSSSATMNPFLALARKNAGEETGDVYGFSLIYSSSYVLKAEGVNGGTTLVTGGIQDFDFSWTLEPGESFDTPEVVLAYSDRGLGGMSRSFHDAYRDHLINPRYVKSPRPVVINNWEGTYFDFDAEKLMSIAKAVEGTGIDTFVLDDGWFGKRDDDTSGLGDWVVNTKKLKGGLTDVIACVNSLGMKFGLWFEPEMVNEDSDLFRAHPDYAIGLPNRARCRSRYQYMLDLTRKEVRDTIVDSVNRVLHENNIEYVKWDYNRNVTESFSFGRDPQRQAEFAHRYALGLYDLCERIVNANPNVFFEGCSSGGARFDPAMLYYFPQIWTSDNTDAEARTLIQYGTSMVYPLSTMSCHVSAVPNHQTGRTTSMETRADIAHLGATGYELDTTKFTAEEKVKIREQVAQYHQMEDLVLYGDLYRTENPFESNYFGFMLVAKDQKKAMLTLYQRVTKCNGDLKLFKAAGLLPDTDYFVPELNRTFKGSTLMNVGLRAAFARGDFATVTYHFVAQNA